MAQPSFAIACPQFHPWTCGVGDHALRLAVELRRRGYRAEILTRAPAAPHPDASDVPVHALTGRFPLQVAEKIRRVVTQQGFTHLILEYVPHMWDAWRFGSPATAWLALAARQAGIDVTVIAHELFIPIAARPDLLLGAGLQRAQLAGMAACAQRLLVTTDTRVEEIMPLWRAAGRSGRPGVLRVGPNALPVPRAMVPGRCRLGVFSTLATTKRFDVVLGAFELVWRRRPESELVLIGDLGAREDRRTAAVYQAIERHPARDRIRVTGKLPLAEVARQMAELDVYLFPMTSGANTRSGTLAVALGCALPVVSINDSETDLRLFRDGENVAFARALTAAAFGERALEILDDPALSARLSAGARRLYDRHLSWEVVGDELLAALGYRSEPLRASA
jgi:glycosyltransferase involved in cell wall biosynthesis